MKTTRQLADELASLDDTKEIYRRLICFLVEHQDGYGVANGERGEAREYARRNGYYWMPCTLCSQWHGGHEGHSIIMLNKNQGAGACLACEQEAKAVREMFPMGVMDGEIQAGRE